MHNSLNKIQVDLEEDLIIRTDNLSLQDQIKLHSRIEAMLCMQTWKNNNDDFTPDFFNLEEDKFYISPLRSSKLFAIHKTQFDNSNPLYFSSGEKAKEFIETYDFDTIIE